MRNGTYKERRRHERIPSDINARYRNMKEEGFSPGTIKNISQSGMLIRGEKAACQEDNVHVVALEHTDEEKFQATARIAWCNREAKELKTDDVADSFLLGLEVIKKTVV